MQQYFISEHANLAAHHMQDRQRERSLMSACMEFFCLLQQLFEKICRTYLTFSGFFESQFVLMVYPQLPMHVHE